MKDNDLINDAIKLTDKQLMESPEVEATAKRVIEKYDLDPKQESKVTA